ncbi:MAG TPA: DUF1775 domain-containing protein [Amycolatopsis sp.]|nr:DUF1775 domain-containing protein [Amycolatopsis sp.]
MSHRQKTFLRVVLALVLAAIWLSALSSPAAAQVSIVPDQITGGGTQTFAFRMANERHDTTATRLELTFPQDPAVAFVRVEPVRGWTETVHSRPLNPPVKAGDKMISEVAATLVLEGGSVPPGQFEQFLVTMGPLPPNGAIVFEATETFANGAVSHWAATPGQGPTISLGPSTQPGAATAPAAAPQDEAAMSAAPAQTAPRAADAGGGPPFGVLWGALGLAGLVIAAVWWRAGARKARAADPGTDVPQAHDEPEVSAK